MERWCRERDRSVGSIVSLEQAWRLATAWYADRLSTAWRRRNPAEVREAFTEIGLMGDFWDI